MYAVVKTGGKQFKVSENDLVQVEQIPGNSGDKVELAEVLLLGEGEDAQIGTPLVQGAKVLAEIVRQERGEKLIVFKKRRRKKYRRQTGHRQNLTLLKIHSIQA
ncbi:MAG: 50S ribosomal protein L21 [Deltaproteobacteria bacterium]|nr:50S ribosomal protein L21 [Deltaproteobacteria bacterium]